MNHQTSDLLSDPELTSKICQLMWDASDAILEVYQSENIDLKHKEDMSPVTQADLAAHHALTRGLAILTPDIPVVSEEDPESLKIPETHSLYWLIDPLDGTKEFIQRNGEFTCNLALINSNRTIYGWVSVPAQSLLYQGGLGMGAMRVNKAGCSTTIRCKSQSNTTRIVASKSHLNLETKQFIEAIEGAIELVQAGSSLKFLKIAEGEADLYPRLAPTCEWDTAAAHAVLEGAGGVITQTDGSPLCYGKSEILNPNFIAQSKRSPNAKSTM